MPAHDMFASAVPLYARYRSGYPADDVDRLAARVGLGGQRAIDIGCGTGQLTVPLARRAGHVLALDPLPQMLAHGRESARAAGLGNITWVQGDSSELATLVEPGARLASFAASFHWTDRAATLAALDDLLAPGASVVVLGEGLDDADQPDWVHAIDELRSEFPGLEPAPGARTRMPVGHQELLAGSAFADVDVSSWSWTRALDVDEVIGLHQTYSFSTPARLGDRLEEFRDRIRAAVLALHPDGRVVEPLRVEVLVATRPA